MRAPMPIRVFVFPPRCEWDGKQFPPLEPRTGIAHSVMARGGKHPVGQDARICIGWMVDPHPVVLVARFLHVSSTPARLSL